MILRILKDLRTGSRHTQQKEFCWALERVMKAFVTGVTGFSRRRSRGKRDQSKATC